MDASDDIGVQHTTHDVHHSLQKWGYAQQHMYDSHHGELDGWYCFERQVPLNMHVASVIICKAASMILLSLA